LPNEPKVVQFLPRILKNKVLTKGIKTDQNRIKTHLKRHETDTKEAKTTPFSPQFDSKTPAEASRSAAF
jgi:hypothetical protein